MLRVGESMHVESQDLSSESWRLKCFRVPSLRIKRFRVSSVLFVMATVALYSATVL